MARFAASYFRPRLVPADVPPPHSLKWQLLAAEELARPGLMRLRAVRQGTQTLDFIWDQVDARAARVLRHSVAELVGASLLEMLAGQRGQRPIFEHYRRVFDSGVAEAALQLHIDHGSEAIHRHDAVPRAEGVAVTLLNLSAARRARALRAGAAPPAPQAASATVGPDSSKPTKPRA
jgi:hypothetical protein